MTLDFIRLPYVEATLAEVHRCGSILPGAVRHKAMKDSYIGSKIYISKQCHDHDILALFFVFFFRALHSQGHPGQRDALSRHVGSETLEGPRSVRTGKIHRQPGQLPER